MKTTPDIDFFKTLKHEGKYKVAPVSCRILSDFITPIEALRILKKASDNVFMLESARMDDTWGRYTFLGFDPRLLITCKDGHMMIGDDRIETSDPSAEIRKVLSDYTSPRIESLPPFTGGLMGYFSYEYLIYSEPTVKSDLSDEDRFQDVDLMLFDKVIAFDNLNQTIVLMVNIELDDIEKNYRKAEDELNELVNLLRSGEKEKNTGGKLLGEVKPLFEKKAFCTMVQKAKEHIVEGDIFQVVLSNRLSAPFSGSLFDTYRHLRTINPSPYMFYFSGTDVEVAGASPETLVKLENGVLHTFPLAGTRKRGTTPEEDEKLEKELLKDEKELAEHNMLVDLGRNDLGRISRFGSVEVEKLHCIERFSHVMHIGSTVKGNILEDRDALDAIEAVLPAGTLSGAPKIRASRIIGELEGSKRGIYGGAIGYIDLTGNMDTCIAIRLVYKKNDTVYVRSGAGIVADSVPENEYQECLNKARASLKALEMADIEGEEI